MSALVEEPTNLGLSEDGHSKLKRFKEDGHFAEMADAYRFAIALALASGVRPPEVTAKVTVFGVATIDPDKEVYAAIKGLIDVGETPVYKWAERFADWGVRELANRLDRGLEVESALQEADDLSRTRYDTA